MSVHDALADIRARAERRPTLRVRAIDNGVLLAAPNPGGFDIVVRRLSDRWLVAFGGSCFHEEFDDPDDAVSFVAFALSERCRVKELGLPFLRRSIVERRDGDVWPPIMEVGALWWPWFKRVKTLQNRLPGAF